ATDEQLHAIIKQVGAWSMPDQPRGHGIKYLAQDKAARGADVHDLLLIVGGAVVRQRLQYGALGIDALTVAGVLTTDDFVEERSIRGQILEVDRTAHQQRVPDRVLQVTVGTFDPAVLVRNTAV